MVVVIVKKIMTTMTRIEELTVSYTSNSLLIDELNHIQASNCQTIIGWLYNIKPAGA